MADVVKRRLTTSECKEISDAITLQIKSKAAQAGRNGLDVHKALVRMNVMLAEMMVDGVDGLTVSAEDAIELTPVIYLRRSPAKSPLVQVIAHEMAEVLMLEWVAAALYHADTVICTDDPDIPGTRHRIACAVDEHFV